MKNTKYHLITTLTNERVNDKTYDLDSKTAGILNYALLLNNSQKQYKKAI